MLIEGSQVVLSPSDLMRFRGCEHAVSLDLRRLMGEALTPAEDSDDAVLVQRMGQDHESDFLESLRRTGKTIIEIAIKGRTQLEILEDTRRALSEGADYIYQAKLADGKWSGYADFLEKVHRPSELGAYSYEVIDTKLKRSPAPQHILQLGIYSRLLANEQGVAPEHIHIVLGTGARATFKLKEYQFYTANLARSLEAFVAAPWSTNAEPVSACGLCRWREYCRSEWEEKHDICLVAGLGKSQRRKLNDVGISTMLQLRESKSEITGISHQTLEKLRTQATLQYRRRLGGGPEFILKPIVPDRGLATLPLPDEGDVFFDMEGDPYYKDGLEYLFGVFDRATGTDRFWPLWAHDREAEGVAVLHLLKWFCAHFEKHPSAHIYHYASYEVGALKRLASLHGTGEALLDQLLRHQRFVDLFKVAQQAVIASEPAYSLKNLEAFYRPARTEIVKTAMGSVVAYEKWRESQSPEILEEIRAYNEVDCRSTMELRDWLVRTVRPKSLPWPARDHMEVARGTERSATEEQDRAEMCAKRNEAGSSLRKDVADLVLELCWYHKREEKPQWWRMFDRGVSDTEELIEDLECLAGLEAVGEAWHEARSQVRAYKYPDQETKLRVGASVKMKEGMVGVTLVELDLEIKVAKVKFGPKAGDPPDKLDLIPGGPIDSEVLKSGTKRAAENIFSGSLRYRALNDLLHQTPPRLRGRTNGDLLLEEDEDVLSGTVRVVSELDNSCLAIQGPPGTGKTYISSHAILSLIRAGKRVGVTSGSHAAIDNLLHAVCERALETNYQLHAIKKNTKKDGENEARHGAITSVTANDDPRLANSLLVGATAWFFSREEQDLAFDYLFVDEAGQFSLANIVACGCAAKNIILVGDPMQLAQPVQGMHPAGSEKSCLTYLLGDAATVPPDRGIFLPVSRRMHPDVCHYISDIVYEGRLASDVGAARQKILGAPPSPIKSNLGLQFLEVEHSGNSQSSIQEADSVARLWHNFLDKTFVDRNGDCRPITPADILIVTPYNAQVNLIRSKLPNTARVGTVDRFQGQEAPICLVSMASSRAEDMPRNMEFLFSVNRLNVAISRAQVLAVVVVNPALLAVPCSTVEQMRLVNALCAVKAYSSTIGSDTPAL